MRIDKFMAIDWDSGTVRILDWALAAASLLLFIWTGGWGWLAGAVVGALAAWYRPLGRLQRFAHGFVRRRR